MKDKDFLTDVVKNVTAQLGEVKKALKELNPVMKPDLTPAQFKAKYGMGKRQVEQLKIKHGTQVVDGLLEKLGGEL